MRPNFWHLQLIQFSKFKNFLCVCWFLGKNLSNFVPSVWKLHNPYCHNIQRYYRLWRIQQRLTNLERFWSKKRTSSKKNLIFFGIEWCIGNKNQAYFWYTSIPTLEQIFLQKNNNNRAHNVILFTMIFAWIIL